MAYQLLLICDEPKWCDLMNACTTDGNFSLETKKTGAMGLQGIMERRPDVAMLDLNIPDIGGLSWLKMLRQTDAGKELPVIVVSDKKSDEALAEAFTLGADDFILKSCNALEVSARIRVVLRRRFERELQFGAALAVGPVMLDPSRHLCQINGKAVTLRPREYELLEILMRKVGRVLSRNYLLETIWGMSRDADTRTVDVAVSRLRKALGLRAGKWIETIERYGYRLRSPEETGR